MQPCGLEHIKVLLTATDISDTIHLSHRLESNFRSQFDICAASLSSNLDAILKCFFNTIE